MANKEFSALLVATMISVAEAAKKASYGAQIVRVGDIVRVENCHSAEPHFYEVSSIRRDGVISQPACFHHDFDEITAIYRHDGKDFRCIWEREKDGGGRG